MVPANSTAGPSPLSKAAGVTGNKCSRNCSQTLRRVSAVKTNNAVSAPMFMESRGDFAPATYCLSIASTKSYEIPATFRQGLDAGPNPSVVLSFFRSATAPAGQWPSSSLSANRLSTALASFATAVQTYRWIAASTRQMHHRRHRQCIEGCPFRFPSARDASSLGYRVGARLCRVACS